MKARVKNLGARVANGKSDFAESLLQRLDWDLHWT